MKALMRLWAVLMVALLALASAAKVPVTFTYDPPVGLEVRSVSLRGSFNNWAELPMHKQDNGTWMVSVELEPGVVQYKFFINGQWPKNMCDDPTFGTPQVDAEAQGCVDDGYGGFNAFREIRLAAPQPAGGESTELAFEHDPSAVRYVSEAAGRLSIRFEARAGSVKEAFLEAGGRYPMHRQLSYGDLEIWRAAVPTSLGEYRIRVVDSGGQEQSFGPFSPPQRPFAALDWVSGRVGYQIFLERFANGDPSNDEKALVSDEYNFNQAWNKDPGAPKPFVSKWSDPPAGDHCCHQYFGGDLAGFLEKLPYLQEQGVSLVYFNPLFDSGSAHGYDTHSYLEVSPKFGDKALLKKALDEAHKRGIRVLFDFVPNHTGLGFFAFQDVLKRGRSSPYWNWYFIKRWPFVPGDASAYEAWGGFGSLPKLNTGNPGVRRYLIEVSKYWLRFGFDGIRVDVVNELIDAHSFFAQWRRELKALKPEAYLVAEIWQRDASWLQGDEFDSLMNYAIGRDVVLRYARGGALFGGSRMLGELARVYATYAEAVAAMGFNLIGSHDTARILTDLGGGGLRDTPSAEALGRVRLAAALLYALPGVPVFFQGDECGFGGEKPSSPPYDLQRYPVQWDRCKPDLQAHFKQLALLRKELPALSSPIFRTFKGDGPVMAFLRGEPGEGEVLAVFNNSTDPARLELPAGAWRDGLEARTYRGELELAPLGWRYLVRMGGGER
ncbi:alpha-amylase family glycosyl hydrolase [Calidithermus timidus]|uniref:alpha-amylase family glycosyl hydrolase n=1 Tax=Calidithermus timidus TaxID=307124 RepID=UPI00035C4E09|nr:alpha-amylase family glycosyl hydrolase [Calidithermus timidus]